MTNYTFRSQVFTPQAAAEVLRTRNTNNRNLAKSKIVQYVSAMKAGEWKFTPVPLIFEAETGRLLDGQNRLTAVVESNTTQTFVVCENAGAGVMSAIDQGKSRSAADHLKIEGVKNNVQMAPLLLALYSYNKDPQGRWAQIKPVSNSVYCDTFMQDPEAISQALGFGKICERSFRLISKTDYAMAYYLLKKAGHSDSVLTEFFNGLTTGASLDDGSPLIAFRNFLINYPDRYSGNRSRRQHSVNNILKAFKLYYNGALVTAPFRAAPLTPTDVPHV